MSLGRESLANYDHMPKRLKSSKFVHVKSFPMYGGIGVSAPSLHRESTDSLILTYVYIYMYTYMYGYIAVWPYDCMEYLYLNAP